MHLKSLNISLSAEVRVHCVKIYFNCVRFACSLNPDNR